MTEQAGFVDREGRGLGVVAADFDGDGEIDLFVANDTTANYLYRNQGRFRFTEQGQEAGVAASGSGGYQAGMGVACADFDGDGRLDIAVTNFYAESTSLYQNLGGGLFTDRTAAAGLTARDALCTWLRPDRPRRQQRRPSRPGPGQWPCRRLPPRRTLRHAPPALAQ